MARRAHGRGGRKPRLVSPLAPGGTIGIVGGGQLGRMTAIAAARFGYRVAVLSPEADCPAAAVARHIHGAYEDPAALAALADAADVVTFEFENVSAEALDLLAHRVAVHPSPHVLRTSQDRVVEKSFLNATGSPTAPWRAIASRAELADAVAALGLPAVLKTTRLGYDGRGQAVLRAEAELDAAWEKLAPKPLILEGFVDFACELSVIVARGVDGTVRVFDATENRHRGGILDLSLAPARVTAEIAAEAEAIARRTAEALELVGVLAVEMFVDRDGSLLANEIAPRPHNSGHWTIEACRESQFAMHVRTVCGLPLPDPGRHADAVMRNLIGPEGMAEWDALLGQQGALVHHYGKAEARPGRKMGHVTWLFPRGALPGELGVAAVTGRP